MKLLKSRKFGDLFNDTFGFLKENAKHLLANYFKLTGVFLILLVLCIIPLINDYINFIQNTFSSSNPDPELLRDNMLNFLSNPALYGLIIIGIAYSIITLNFMPIYFDLYDRNKGNNFNLSDIIESYKANIKSILIMLGLLFLLSIPIYIAVFVTMFISLFTIIGIFIIIGFLMSYFQLMWFNVIRHKTGNFNIFGKTFTLYKDNFMNIIGVTLIISLIKTGLSSVITFILLMVGGAIISPINIDPESPENLHLLMEDSAHYFVIFYSIIFIISTVLNLLLQINQGIIFYSQISDIEGITSQDEIDTIGLK